METYTHIKEIESVFKISTTKFIIPGPGFVLNKSTESKTMRAISVGGEEFEWDLNPKEICPIKVKEILELPGTGDFLLW